MSDELIASAEIGEQARVFLESELGKVLTGLAEQEAELAREALTIVDPTDSEKIIKYQNDVKVAKWFTRWLAELIDEGNQAMQVFKQQQESE